MWPPICHCWYAATYDLVGERGAFAGLGPAGTLGSLNMEIGQPDPAGYVLSGCEAGIDTPTGTQRGAVAALGRRVCAMPGSQPWEVFRVPQSGEGAEFNGPGLSHRGTD